MPPDTISCTPAAMWPIALTFLVIGFLLGYAWEPLWRAIRVRWFLRGSDPNLKSFQDRQPR